MSNTDDFIRLGAGGGGQQQRQLIEEITSRLSNPLLDPLEDSCIIPDVAAGSLAFTTDSFVVSPLSFPGGNVGKLAVCGTVNDLAMMGAQPRWLSAGLLIEEGLDRAELLGYIDAMAIAAREAGVQIVTGDSKVVERGKGDGLFINTSGIGTIPAGRNPGAHRIQPGQLLVVSGTIGDHSIAVMFSREGLDFEVDAVSDCAPLNGLVEVMYGAIGQPRLHSMRDLTRGGLAAVLNEYAEVAGCDMLVTETAIPVRQPVAAAARVLGFDPAVLANEGKLLAVVDPDCADQLISAMQDHKYGRDAAVIGEVGPRFNPASPRHERPRRPLVLFKTASGGEKSVEMPLGELLPRIC